MGYKITDINIVRIKNPPKPRKRKVSEPHDKIVVDHNHHDEHHNDIHDDVFIPERTSNAKKIIWSVIALAIIAGLLFWTFNAKASIIIEAQQAFVEVVDLPIESSIEIPLSYTVSATTSVDSYKSNDKKATGKVTFYNTYSTSAQKLNVKTRIQTASGLLYYTRTAVTVPGYKGSGSKITPGTVTVTVDAAKVGSSSNVPKGQKLTISAYKGTTRGTKLYATSFGISGGSTGKIPVISDKTNKGIEETAVDNAVANFEASLSDARSEPGVIILYSSTTLDSAVENDCCSKENTGTTTVTVSGLAYRLNEIQILTDLVKKYKLKIKEQMSESIDIVAENLGIDEIESIKDIEIIDGTPTINKATVLVYTKFNEEQIVSEIKGQNVQDAMNLIQQNNHVRSEISMNPFWVRTIPKNSDSVKIEFKR